MSGFVFVGGGTGSTFFEGAFMTGAFAAGLTAAILASGVFGFFCAIGAGVELLEEDTEDFVVFCGATGLATGFTLGAPVFRGFWAISLAGFWSGFPFEGAFFTGDFDATVFAAIALGVYLI